MRGRGDAPRLGWQVLASLPALLLCGAMLAGIGTGIGDAGGPGLGHGTRLWLHGAVLVWARHALPVAGAATLASLALGAPAAAAGAGRGGWLALWLVPAGCVAAWPLLPLAPGVAAGVARATILTLPVMVMALSSAWSGLPAGLSCTAAAAGAGPGRRALLRVRLALPGALRACAIVAALCLGLSAWRSGAG